MPVPETQPQGEASIATDAQTQQHLFEVTPAVFAMARGGAGRPRVLCSFCISALEGDCRRILGNPGRLHRIRVERPQGNLAKDLLEMRLKPGIQHLSQSGVMERGGLPSGW